MRRRRWRRKISSSKLRRSLNIGLDLNGSPRMAYNLRSSQLLINSIYSINSNPSRYLYRVNQLSEKPILVNNSVEIIIFHISISNLLSQKL